MTGPTKDAGVERIARLESDFRSKIDDVMIAWVNEHPTASWGGPPGSVLADRIAALLPHPPVDPAAEEVAGRLAHHAEPFRRAVTAYSVELDQPSCADFAKDLDAAATLIRSQSARIAELEGENRQLH